jgi:hypothetical protein
VEEGDSHFITTLAKNLVSATSATDGKGPGQAMLTCYLSLGTPTLIWNLWRENLILSQGWLELSGISVSLSWESGGRVWVLLKVHRCSLILHQVLVNHLPSPLPTPYRHGAEDQTQSLIHTLPPSYT